jgi:hypothetical protein
MIAVSVIPGDDMEMGVEDFLSGAFFVVHVDIDAVGFHCFFDGYREFLERNAYLSCYIIRHIVYLLAMHFRDDDRVTLIDRPIAQENKYILVLVYVSVRFYFTRYDFAENAALHKVSIPNRMYP